MTARSLTLEEALDWAVKVPCGCRERKEMVGPCFFKIANLLAHEVLRLRAAAKQP